MNRELKFRYYDDVVKSFVYSDEFQMENPFDQLQAFFTKAATYTKSVQQYTGLKDKNGKEIYEGDIIKCYQKYWSEEEDKFLILKKDNGVLIEFVGYVSYFNPSHYVAKWVVSCNNSTYNIDASETVTPEIIGNICENPELLKQ